MPDSHDPTQDDPTQDDQQQHDPAPHDPTQEAAPAADQPEAADVADPAPAAQGDAGVQTPYYESEWSPAYAETQIRQTPPDATPPADPAEHYTAPPPYGYAAQPPYTADPFAQGYQAVPPPAGGGYPPMGPAYSGGQYPGGYGAGPVAGPAPADSQVSAILATVIGGLVLASCYGTLLGIAPLVLGIMAINKSNSVSRLWGMGLADQAYDAAESARKLSMWAWISLAIGIAVALVIILVVVIIATTV
ncbi:hypothetical protein [Gordonia shandongensis]|uniref:hypothetical protein n=1 Tax=Gordonia shandongensis TaxID=376351 RepID=UPI0004101061|nr:hypothetical protein [Gordonia shandongensis]